MSDINDDKQVIEDGRKAPLTGVDAPLRDQIVQKLFKRLDEEDIGTTIIEMWRKGNANRTFWLERQKAYLQTWDEHLPGDATGAFDGSSQLHIPMPLIVCKTLHARFMQAVWQDPPLNCKARTAAAEDRVSIVQDTLRYYLMDGANYHQGVEKTVDQWVWDWITAGSGIMKWRWDVKYERYIDVTTVTKHVPSIQVKDGQEASVMVPSEEEQEVPVTKKVFEGPVLELKEPEDVMIIGGGGDPDLADAVLELQYLTASELWTLVDRKVFDKDAVEEIISGQPDLVSASQGNEIKVMRAQNAGKAKLDHEEDLDRYGVIEAYLSKDVDGSGINSQVVCWIGLQTGRLCRATYLRRIIQTGERPYVKADYHLRKGQEYGTGLVEMLYPLSKELDAIHNMRLDFGLISVMPFGFYRASSGIEPETLQLEPGMLIPCDNPQTDVFFPNLGNRTVFGMQEEQALQTMIERLTSVSDVNLGVVGGQGITRTASGSKMLGNEMSSNLDVHLRRLNRGWKKALRHLMHTLQQRIPPGLSFRVTGDDGADYWRNIKDQDDLAGDFDIEVSANSATSNVGIQQENAGQILQLTSNPLNIQLGIVSPAQHYEALKNYLQALGVRDYGRYIVKPQGYERQYTPLQEMDMVLMGIDVPVAPGSDHQGFIDLYKHFMEDEYLHGQLNQAHVGMLTQHKMKHEQMLAAMKQQAAQQANISQMKMNAQAGMQGATPAGAGLMASPQAPVTAQPVPVGEQ